MKTYLYITPFFPSPSNWRGAYCLNFIAALKRTLNEWNVEVFRPGDGTDYEIDGITVRTFKTRQLPSNVFPFLFRKYNEKSFIDKVKAVGEAEGWKTDDIAICHGNTATFAIYPLAVKRLSAKCKTLLHHHDLASFGLNTGRLRHCWLYNLYMFPVLRKLHEAIDTHVFISEASRKSFLMAPDTSWTIFEDYKRQMRGLPYRSVKIKDSIILHNGVDKSIFNVEGKTKSVKREDESFVIGCVGNFDELKDQITLIRAVERINEVEGRPPAHATEDSRLRLRFVGSGPCLEECKRYAKERNIDAEFLTEMRHEQLSDFYRSLDLFVLPSYFEGFGCVFTEAHSCGVPFITCEDQGICDVLAEVKVRDEGEQQNASPWLCKPKDPEDLANKIAGAIDKLKARVEGEHRKEINLIQPLTEDQDINKGVKRFIANVLR